MGCLNRVSSPSLFCLIASDLDVSSRRIRPDGVLGDRVLPALLLDILLVLALACEVSRGVLRGVTGGLPGSAFTAASSLPSTTSGFCLAFNSEIAAPMFKPRPALRP